jgi:hypothetical protein
MATHAPSRIEVRLPRSGQRLTGLVGVDDDVEGHATTIVFKVTTIDGKKILFQSQPLANGHAAVPFAVPLQGATELLLTAEIAPPATTIDNAHADWLDLKVLPGG